MCNQYSNFKRCKVFYILPKFQEEIIEKICNKHTGFGFGLYQKCIYLEPKQFNTNNMVLGRYNFFDRLSNIYRDIYVDFFGDVYVFDNDNRYAAQKQADLGYLGLTSLVFERSLGYYICPKHTDFHEYSCFTTLARSTVADYIEKYGKPVPRRTNEEERLLIDTRDKALDEKIKSKTQEYISNKDQRIKNSKGVKVVAKNLGIIGIFRSTDGTGYGSAMFDIDPFWNEMIFPDLDKQRIKLIKTPLVDAENNSVTYE